MDILKKITFKKKLWKNRRKKISPKKITKKIYGKKKI